MEKLLIRLSVPILKESYDLFVPADVCISELIPVITKGVEDLTNGMYKASGLELLSVPSLNLLMKPSLTLEDYSVTDGYELMLL